jgi:uncharacterized protein (DUF302 family)
VITRRIGSEGSAESVLSRVKRILPEHKLQLLWTYDVQTKLFEQGIHYDRDCYVLEVSEPNLTKKMLVHDPRLAVFLPARMVITGNRDKSGVEVTVLLPGAVADAPADETSRGLLKELETRLHGVLEALQKEHRD